MGVVRCFEQHLDNRRPLTLRVRGQPHQVGQVDVLVAQPGQARDGGQGAESSGVAEYAGVDVGERPPVTAVRRRGWPALWVAWRLSTLVTAHVALSASECVLGLVQRTQQRPELGLVNPSAHRGHRATLWMRNGGRQRVASAAENSVSNVLTNG